MTRLQQRPLNIGDIEYIYIPKQRQDSRSILFPPDDFKNNELHWIRTCPKNLVQLNDPFVFYGNVKVVQSYVPHRFAVIYPDSIDVFIKKNPYKTSVKIFLVHSEIEDLKKIIEKLKDEFTFVLLIRADKPDSPIIGFEDISITNPHDLLKKLQSRKKEIEKILLEAFPKQQIEFKIDLTITDLHHSFNPYHSFAASETNYWTLNQILGNAWVTEPNNKEEEIDEKKIIAAAETVKKDRNDPWRLKILLDQVKKMDELEIMVCEDRGTKFPNGHYDWLSPLIITVPFNFPSLGEILDPAMGKEEIRRFSKILSYEQGLNYVSYTPIQGHTPEDVFGQGQFQRTKTNYLDSVAYLHASFTNSPVIRFPLLGNSIKTELSFFKPDSINETKWKNSKELIDKFGKKLSSLILPKEMEDCVFEMPRQIIAISDLPVEWLLYKGMNLCYSHDITRIPEMPYGGIMASFNTNSNVQFEIEEDILSRTLVLLGASTEDDKDEEFKAYFNAIEEHSKTLNFKTFRCSSIQDVIEQIHEHQPDFLIFDCHGGTDADELSSFLKINNERLTGDDIVNHKIVAPLVFLSACHTNPNYGYVNKLADAFFEAGCIAITATYFPISVKSGSNIYFRLLNNLANAAKMSVHKNWLEFVSHTIRTSYYKDIIYQSIENIEGSTLSEMEKVDLQKALTDLNLKTGLKMLRQDTRQESLSEFKSKLDEICPKDFIETTVPEYCFYTNMGRGDLVRFNSWNQKFDQLNEETNSTSVNH